MNASASIQWQMIPNPFLQMKINIQYETQAISLKDLAPSSKILQSVTFLLCDAYFD